MIGIAAIAAAAAVVGALGVRLLAPTRPQPAQQRRPIVQIVRPQPGLPSIADQIDAACPSIAMIVPGGKSPDRSPPRTGKAVAQVPAFAVSADGWLATTDSVPQARSLDALFPDGTRLPLVKVKTDPVSGIAVARVKADDLHPLVISDQTFPRIGDFGFALLAPNASGCAAQVAMIASDFVADGGGPVSYVRIQSAGSPIPAGAPFLGSDGEVIGVETATTAASEGTILPGAVAGIVIDELIRGQPSPTIAFGFRATDFAQAVFARLANGRARGAGVALVRPGSGAGKAGLRAGDVIVAVDGSPVSSASELGRAVDAADKEAAFDVLRGDRRLKLTVKRSVSH